MTSQEQVKEQSKQATKEVLVSVGKWLLVMAGIFLGNMACVWLGYDGLIGNAVWEFGFIYVPIVWITLAILFGIMEAYLWAYKVVTGDVYNYNEHPLLTVIRLLIMFLCARLLGNIWQPILLWGMFSFFHDGSYYLRRKNLALKKDANSTLYKEGWFAQSTTSTAFWTNIMSPAVRTTLFAVCLVAYVIYQEIFTK